MTAEAAPTVYRPVLVRALYLVFLAFGGWWLWTLATGSDRAGLLVGVPAVAAAAVLGWACFWRSAVHVDERGVRLLNVVRDVEVPWERLEEVQTRYALTLVAQGRAYRSWAAAAPGRPSMLRMSSAGTSADHLPNPRWTPDASAAPAASRALSADSGAAAFIVEQGWTRWRDTPARLRPAAVGEAAVAVRWNLPVLAATGGGAVLALLAGVLGG